VCYEQYSAGIHFITHKSFASHFLILLLYLYDVQWCYNHVKCETVPIQAIKAYRGSGNTAPLILNLRTGWRLVVSATPGHFTSGKRDPWYLLDRKMGGLQGQYAYFGKEKKLCLVPGLELGSSSP
jgi:hypothetical protein